MTTIKRRPIVRQATISPAAQREGLKVLEKYCRKKYRHSTSLLNELDDVGPFSSGPSSVPLRSKGSEGTFSFPDTDADEKPQISPTPTARLWKYLPIIYRKLGIGRFLLLALLFTYTLLGGVMFLHIERPHEEKMMVVAQKEATARQNDFAHRFQRIIASNNCSSRSSKTGDCLEALKEIIIDYDRVTGLDKRTRLPVWKWDYWTAVYFAWALLTTIGYGNMHCRTVEGRTLTVLYTLFGLPLMLAVLRSLGTLLFNGADAMWDATKRSVRNPLLRRLGRLPEKEKRKLDGDASTAKLSGNQTEELADFIAVDDSPQESLEETFPLLLALAIVFLYIALCSAVILYWETDWDYFTAVYFVFISLSTVGLGDEMPAHPHYACGFFFFFLVGLALVSMCVSVMQMRYEARYYAALQLIDEEAQENGGVITVIPQQEVDPLLALMPAMSVDDSKVTVEIGFPGVRLRPSASVLDTPQTPNSLDSPRTPLFSRRQSSISPSGGSGASGGGAVLGALLSRRNTIRRTRRSSSAQSGSISGDDASGAYRLSQPPLSPQSAGSTAGEPYRPTRTSVIGIPLSVITEATDEEKAHRSSLSKVDFLSRDSTPLLSQPARSPAVGTPLSVITETMEDHRRAPGSTQLRLRRESSVDEIAEEDASPETATDNTSSTNDAS